MKGFWSKSHAIKKLSKVEKSNLVKKRCINYSDNANEETAIIKGASHKRLRYSDPGPIQSREKTITTPLPASKFKIQDFARAEDEAPLESAKLFFFYLFYIIYLYSFYHFQLKYNFVSQLSIYAA